MKTIMTCSMALILMLSGCSSSDKNCAIDSLEGSSCGTNLTFQPNSFPGHANFANNCSSTDDIAEKMFLRSWTHDYYLWYSEVDDIDPDGYTVTDYFDLLKTSARTSSGALKDQFHFWIPTDDYEKSSAGLSYGYGIEWEFESLTGNRTIKVRYLEPTRAQALSAISRGDELIRIDSTDIDTTTQSGIDFLNEALFAPMVNKQYLFWFKPTGSAEYSVSLSSGNYHNSSVHTAKTLNYSSSHRLGYLLFNSFIGPAEKPLIDAFKQFKNDNIEELVLDLRYNGGGLLWMASQLAYMVAGDATANKVFELSQFNNKHATTNPITLEAILPLPFYPLTIGYASGVNEGESLPKLNLNRVYILTSEETCSASEAVINSLRGIDVEVILVGDTTCGKPYGYYPQNNCDNTYFSIQFKGVNHKGFGDYSDGFTPQNSSDITAERVTGCSVLDTMNDDLGNSNEVLLKQAIDLIEGGVCNAVPVSMMSMQNFNSVRSLDGTGGIKDDRPSPFHIPVKLPGRILSRP